jgi:hypothetical protein
MTRPRLLVAVAAAALLVLLAVVASRAVEASAARLAAARRALAATEADLARLDELGRRRERVASVAPPESDLIDRVLSALAAAGVPGDRFDGLSAEGAAPLAAGGGGGLADLHRQSTRIRLQSVELLHLHLLLDRWRRDHRLWVPTRFEITPAGGPRARADSPVPLSETAVDVQIVLTAVHRAATRRGGG